MYYVKVIITTKYEEDYEVTGELIEFNNSLNSKDPNLSVAPGIIEQYASIRLYDRDNTFRDAAILDSVDIFKDAKVTFYASMDDEDVKIGSYIIDSIKMQMDNNEVQIQCVDKSDKLSSIKIEEYPVADRTADDLLNIVFQDFIGENWIYLDSETENNCKNTLIPNSFMNSTNAREVLQAICSVAMVNIWYDTDNFVVGGCL